MASGLMALPRGAVGLVQRGVCVIPRSSSPAHIRANLEALEGTLSAEEMRLVDGVDAGRRCMPDVSAVMVCPFLRFEPVGPPFCQMG